MSNESTFERNIQKVWTSNINDISATHQNRLVLEPGKWSDYDPFLFLAEDWFQRGSFDVHPHRGIETVTYVLSGKLEHYDNSSNSKDVLQAGDAQWMTAGRGVIHKEDPAVGEKVHSLQLWLNLPSEHKMTEPSYQNLRSSDMPTYEADGAKVIIFSGSSNGLSAATKNYVPVTMVEIQLQAGATIKQSLPGSYNGFLYVLEGEGEFGAERTEAGEGNALQLGSGGEHAVSLLTITAQAAGLRVLLYAGEPLDEPVVARGPFVMNTQEQIVQAYQDYREGKFV
jgi:redox-sensitive bicupin YhaK (pirin superfamily)